MVGHIRIYQRRKAFAPFLSTNISSLFTIIKWFVSYFSSLFFLSAPPTTLPTFFHGRWRRQHAKNKNENPANQTEIKRIHFIAGYRTVKSYLVKVGNIGRDGKWRSVWMGRHGIAEVATGTSGQSPPSVLSSLPRFTWFIFTLRATERSKTTRKKNTRTRPHPFS